MFFHRRLAVRWGKIGNQARKHDLEGMNGMYLLPLNSMLPIQGIESASQQNAKPTAAGSPFANIMQEAIENLQQSQQAAAQDSYDLAMGDVSSLHSMMINSAMETTAVETMVQLTSRAVSAYKEVMQMQI